MCVVNIKVELETDTWKQNLGVASTEEQNKECYVKCFRL